MAAPQDDVGPNELLDQIHDGRVHGQVQEATTPAHAFAVVPLHMGTHEFFRAHAGVVANELVERVLQLLHKGGLEAVVGNQIALALVGLDLGGREAGGHGHLL